jgi:hypothetical protein
MSRRMRLETKNPHASGGRVQAEEREIRDCVSYHPACAAHLGRDESLPKGAFDSGIEVEAGPVHERPEHRQTMLPVKRRFCFSI